MTITPKEAKIERIKTLLSWTSLALILVMMVAYAYFVNQAVLNVVERENLDTRIAQMTAQISGVESDYNKKITEIDKNLAYNKGFREAQVTKYISRKPLVESVSLNKPEE